MKCSLISPPKLSHLLSKTLTSTTRKPFSSLTTTTMSINLKSHAFAGNPIRSAKTPKHTDPFSPISALETLKTRLRITTTTTNEEPSAPYFKILPFKKGKPLAFSGVGDDKMPNWHLGWVGMSDYERLLGRSGVELNENSFVYLGSRVEEDSVYWAVDVCGESQKESRVTVAELGGRRMCFVELRTLMVATDWADERAMGDLAIAGHARALLEWHSISLFCGHCGAKTVPMEAGRRKQCSNELCNKRVYPRVDPVVIMLVIDRENDRALLSRQSRFVPRMWSCLAGFIEPGESLEEAVRRETWEETGIEVGEVMYHSSQPWPVGPNSMPCQLMVGFFAFAKSLEINVDKEELEDAQWHSREDVKKALTFAEYKKAQTTAAAKVEQMCKGVGRGQSLSTDFNLESGELAQMFVPGPFAIAHHLISTWVHQGPSIGADDQSNQPCGSLSSL